MLNQPFKTDKPRKGICKFANYFAACCLMAQRYVYKRKECAAMDLVNEFETSRLIMRQWTAADYEPFATLASDPEVMKYFPKTLNRSESDAWIDKAKGLLSDRGWGFWVCQLKSTNQFIGFTGLHIPSTNFSFSPCVEVGWRLGKEFWGKGYATEAGIASLKFAFQNHVATEIVSFTAVSNNRSSAVMERLGMKRIGTFEHPDISEETGLRKHYLYKITETDFYRKQRET